MIITPAAVYRPHMITGFSILKSITTGAGVPKAWSVTAQTTMYITQGAPLDTDIFTIHAYCSGSETSLKLLARLGSSMGIVDVYVNGVLKQAGIDFYAAAAADIVTEIATTTVYGKNIIELKVNGKNAASTGYGVRYYDAILI